jgi:hypothetical protein
MQRSTVLVAACVGLFIGLFIGGLWLWDRQARELVFAIPPGTAARQSAGEEVAIFPPMIAIDLNRQDTLVIRNDDSVPVTVGPFRVEPGQRFVQRYRSPGTFELLCSAHGGETLRIVVTR